jgi:hypothetical protein
LHLNVRYYSTVWRFPPTYCTSTGLPTSTSNFPVSLRHPVYYSLLLYFIGFNSLLPHYLPFINSLRYELGSEHSISCRVSHQHSLRTIRPPSTHLARCSTISPS